MSIRRLMLGPAALLSAGLLAYALSAEEARPAAEGAEEKVEAFDYTVTKHGTRKVLKLDLGGGVTMEFVRIPRGTFLMGSPDSDKDAFDSEKPRHEVEIAEDFYLGKFLVTKTQFTRFVDAADYKTEAETDGKGGVGYDGTTFVTDPKYSWREPGFPQKGDHPVVNVTWNDATAFCKWASDVTKRQIELPTEAQWEYACRAGTTTRFFTGDKAESLEGSANILDRAASKQFPDWTGVVDFDDGYVFTSPVGKFRPNPFGLYDMIGNTREWCADNYDEKSYAIRDKKDPYNASSGKCVLRGGPWDGDAKLCRCANRYGREPEYRFLNIGFRVALRLD